MSKIPEPTDRELAILKVLWELEEASVRQVYERLREELPIVQNTVQAFLRTMEEKGLVCHRVSGRSFIYRPVTPRDQTSKSLVSSLLDQVFDGAVDQLVKSALDLKAPSSQELGKLRELLQAAEDRSRRKPRQGGDA
ncbi:MAG: BlaI/MecI/CopY family transcriptional regulator [Planctomycetota bacterium]|jgi:predicted transcriptional regulator